MPTDGPSEVDAREVATDDVNVVHTYHNSMSDDTTGEGEMTKINVRVPTSLLAEIDEVYDERGYPNRSEFIRDALRTAVDPPVRLSEEILGRLAESREEAAGGETISLDELRERRGRDG